MIQTFLSYSKWCIRWSQSYNVTDASVSYNKTVVHSVHCNIRNCCSFGSENGLCPELQKKSKLKKLMVRSVH